MTKAEQARSHGSGLYQVDARGPVVGGRDSTAVAVLTMDGGRAHGERRATTRQSPARTSAPPTPAPGRRQERGRSIAGTYNPASRFSAARRSSACRGPVPNVRPGRCGQRPRQSGLLAAISAVTAAWLGWTYRCSVASRLWPLTAISKGALTFASPRWVSREGRSWCRVLPPE